MSFSFSWKLKFFCCQSNNFLTVGNNKSSQEIERLQQLLVHKEELMAQKDKLIESLERELALLRKLTSGQN